VARRPVTGRRVLLGVTGGIASYKAVWLARQLTQDGAEVDVVVTRSALEFVGAVTFEAVTGRRVHSDIFERGHALDHIRLAREADVIVIAPATADFLARAVHGQADDLLSAILLAATCPVLLVPAMNDRMWAHAQTQRNAAHAREIGYHVLDPAVGPLAFGEGSGAGRMPEPDEIAAYTERLLETDQSLQGQHVVVTAGATREAIDPVRFISNHSSGRMGIAIARAAWRRGAQVTLIAGHVDVSLPHGVNTVRIDTTDDLLHAVRATLPSADVVVMAAAPADFRAASVAAQKIKKGGAAPTITLDHTPDVLRTTVDDRKAGSVIVGFALETNDLVNAALKKMREKSLDLIVANHAGEPGAGFGTDTNRVTIIDRNGVSEELPLMSKDDVADRLLDRIAEVRNGR
jgi:phosphopantothenoylcysteine decarboxylase/phosphopantothenate--cysteine ligase